MKFVIDTKKWQTKKHDLISVSKSRFYVKIYPKLYNEPIIFCKNEYCCYLEILMACTEVQKFNIQFISFPKNKNVSKISKNMEMSDPPCG